MNALQATEEIAEPLGTVGMMFYFSPQSAERAKPLDMDVVALYAAGRGGVLGDRTADEIDDIFFFFKPGMITQMVENARSKASRDVGVGAHLDAAKDYADATFGGIDETVLNEFSAAVKSLAATLPAGQWPIVDGYLALEVPSTPRHEAYYWAIIMRELRGGVHTDAVKAAGLSASESCQLDRGGAFFALHGYSDDDKVEETEELIATRAAAEADTTAREAALLQVLGDAQLATLVAGARAMADAVNNPVPA
jgi:hypothetical protein